MSIPESQLQKWAVKHQTDKAVNTHQRIRKAIEDYEYSRMYYFETFLQGSYRNDTNIWADTDVDIVVQLNSLFSYEGISGERINSVYAEASYTLEDFKTEVITALRSAFGYFNIEVGRKSIKVRALNDNMYNADVIVARQHRFYVPFETEDTKYDKNMDMFYYEGISFDTPEGRIVNYPELHYKEGVRKHKRTGEKFKKIVRIFKNMRNKAVEKFPIFIIDNEIYVFSKDTAPSYFIQCLLYNVPDELYNFAQFSNIVQEIINWAEEILYSDEIQALKSQNKIVPLFGEGSDKWNVNDARIFIKAMKNLWINWDK